MLPGAYSTSALVRSSEVALQVAPPTFARDVQPIFTKRCALGGCHSIASHQGGMSLDASVAYENIVGVASSEVTSLKRVQPRDHASSWLWRRIQPDPSLRQGAPRMPLAATPLTANQITTIMNWIDEGAPRN